MKQSSGIIVKCNNRILVCKRSIENSEGGKWSIPMGGIEQGEKPEDAAYREFHEEMGVEIKIITGDNELVAQKICRDVGLNIRGILLGSDLDNLTNVESNSENENENNNNNKNNESFNVKLSNCIKSLFLNI